MTTRRQIANDNTQFWTLNLVQENPSLTQRTLVKEVGKNVSSINYFLKAFAKKDWVKMSYFSNNPDKLDYAYLLTFLGMAEKAALSHKFLQRKIAAYKKLRVKIETLKQQTQGDVLIANGGTTP